MEILKQIRNLGLVIAFFADSLITYGGSITPVVGSSTDIRMESPALQAGMTYGVTGLTEGMTAYVTITLDSIGGSFQASLRDDSTGNLIGSTNVYTEAGETYVYSIPFTAISTSATLSLTSTSMDGGGAIIHLLGYPYDTTILENVVTTVCSDEWYRYGHNGQMKNNQIAGLGNWYEFDFREFSPRDIRFKSVDPLSAKYPFYSSYQFAGNTPIWARELEGLEPDCSTSNPDADANNVTKGMGDDCEGPAANPIGLKETPINASSHPEHPVPQADPNQSWNGSYGSYNIFQARDLNINFNPEARAMADRADQIAMLWTGVGAAPFAVMGEVEAAPIGLSWFLSNPAAWTAVGGDVLLMSGGYQGPGVSEMGAVEPNIGGKGFNSFSAFKKEMGPAGPGMAWHHVVDPKGGDCGNIWLFNRRGGDCV